MNKFNLIWRDGENNNFNVGELSFRSDKYYFEYNESEVKKAMNFGFETLPLFPKVSAKYFKEELFKTFQEWINEKESKDKDLAHIIKDACNDKFYFEEK
ncbi:hypothetical protein [Clostridium sp. UBA4548]|uniref:hypothetical protein n=1 Tax=Clostridium sp. UBA4548 TaxID=1946361 RepID=UPI0025BC0810|nr:hypothetical protein [Clostridium sp. UBA4548]